MNTPPPARPLPLVLRCAFDRDDRAVELVSGPEPFIRNGELSSDGRCAVVYPRLWHSGEFYGTTAVAGGGRHFDRFDDVMLVNELLSAHCR